MIQCDACNQCFHDVCVKTNTRVWENLDSVWLFMNLNPIVCSINIFILAIILAAELAFRTLLDIYISDTTAKFEYQLHYVDNG